MLSQQRRLVRQAVVGQLQEIEIALQPGECGVGCVRINTDLADGKGEQEFREFKSGTRLMPEKMKPRVDAPSEDDIKALVEYFASLQ